MSQDRLSSLAVLNIEADLTAGLNADNIVSVYAVSNYFCRFQPEGLL